MADPILTWTRLYYGRNWHILDAANGTALCGMKPLKQAETMPMVVPAGAHICRPCVVIVHRQAALAAAALAADPRRPDPVSMLDFEED